MHNKHAIEYAKRGWPVFPCSAKVPLTPNGYKDASTNPDVVNKLFSKNPNCNIGLVTGKASGIMVLDIDVKENAGGDASLMELEKSHGALPSTMKSLTWSKGRHFFFKYPGHGIGCKIGVKPGIDIKGDGGYVIVPPSSVNGGSYKWESKSGPGEIELSDAPAWLLDLIDERKPPIDLSNEEDKIHKAHRNSSLARIAGGLRRYGMDADYIDITLQKINSERCDPPLSKREVTTIANSVAKYAPEKSIKPRDSIDYTIIADSILKDSKFIYCAGNFYEWQSTGAYKEMPLEFVQKLIKKRLLHKFCINKTNEIAHCMRVETAIGGTNMLNNSELLNLKNGMLDLETMKLLPHDIKYNSTIQLPVSYSEDAKCGKWLSSLQEMFKHNIESVDVLQEFFGLCLTKETKYDKALFMLGEGRNGKSTILYVFQHILGEVNTSSVSLEMLDNTHYVADLFGKLVNVSIETSAKSSINDAKFKSIISGDMLHADRKYGQPFDFRPFCKLIFALNNMPQVSDKTDAFFHRLLIVKFNRQFVEEEQNKNLKYEIVSSELDGIFMWMLHGLRRLKDRGYFSQTNEMRAETEEYRKENNNVLTFVDEECIVEPQRMVIKDFFYKQYVDWCRNSGLKSFSKKRFGIQLVKHFNLEKDSKDTHGVHRVWRGIDLQI